MCPIMTAIAENCSVIIVDIKFAISVHMYQSLSVISPKWCAKVCLDTVGI